MSKTSNETMLNIAANHIGDAREILNPASDPLEWGGMDMFEQVSPEERLRLARATLKDIERWIWDHLGKFPNPAAPD